MHKKALVTDQTKRIIFFIKLPNLLKSLQLKFPKLSISKLGIKNKKFPFLGFEKEKSITNKNESRNSNCNC
jgi:hypothetical protein